MRTGFLRGSEQQPLPRSVTPTAPWMLSWLSRLIAVEWMRGCARTGSLALAVSVVCLLRSVPTEADVLPLIESACGPTGSWLCYDTGVVTGLATTHEAPVEDWSITPTLPPDTARWVLVNVSVSFSGSAAYSLTYPDSSFFGSAILSRASFIDSSGRTLVSASRGLDGSCFPGAGSSAGSWSCSDGDIFQASQSFGSVDGVELFGGILGRPVHPLVPDLPSLAGPITLRLEWTVFTSGPPLSSVLNVNGAFLGYAFAPVPEPSSALLLASGVAGLAILDGRRRRRDSARVRASPCAPPSPSLAHDPALAESE